MLSNPPISTYSYPARQGGLKPRRSNADSMDPSEYSEDFSYSDDRRQTIRSRSSIDEYETSPDVKLAAPTSYSEQAYAWVRITLDRAEGLRQRENGENPDVVATVRSLSTIPS